MYRQKGLLDNQDKVVCRYHTVHLRKRPKIQKSSFEVRHMCLV